MNAKTMHLVVDRNLIWERCGDQLRKYRDSLETNAVGRRSPFAVEEEALSAAECIEHGRALPDALCVRPRNTALECLFQADGNAHNCARAQAEYDHCWRDPAAYKAFLMRSTPQQKRDVRFNFSANPGSTNPYA